MNDTSATSGCATIAAPASPFPCTRLITSGGRPASSRISTNRWPVIGTSSAGLNTHAVPADERRKHFPRGNRERKILNGVMMPATPIGRRKLIAHLLRQFARHRVWPNSRRRPPGGGIERGVDPFLNVAAGFRERLAHLASHDVGELFSFRAIIIRGSRRRHDERISPRAGAGVRRLEFKSAFRHGRDSGARRHRGGIAGSGRRRRGCRRGSRCRNIFRRRGKPFSADGNYSESEH